jgi:hypothetical protein
LARFERQEATADRLADSLGAATEQLRAALEREAVEIINKAREQAAGIEDAARQHAASIEQAARQRADEVEREARARAGEARDAQSRRVAQLLEGVEALEERTRNMFADLRTQLNGAIEEDARPAAEPVRPTAPTPGQSGGNDGEEAPIAEHRDPEPEPAGGDKGVAAFPKPIPLSLATEVDAGTNPSPELDEMMRAQIVTLAETGKSRADAERFLSRFKFGESYAGMVDEIYSERERAGRPDARSKRRRLGRRRA